MKKCTFPNDDFIHSAATGSDHRPLTVVFTCSIGLCNVFFRLQVLSFLSDDLPAINKCCTRRSAFLSHSSLAKTFRLSLLIRHKGHNFRKGPGKAKHLHLRLNTYKKGELICSSAKHLLIEKKSTSPLTSYSRDAHLNYRNGFRCWLLGTQKNGS